jgi:transcriptional regulator with XRE-family HTH domain
MKNFSKYLKKKNIKAWQFAFKVGVTVPTAYNWLNGKSVPSLKKAIEVEKMTNGELTVYSWLE